MRSFIRRLLVLISASALGLLLVESRPASQAPQAPTLIAPASDVQMRAWNTVVSDWLRTGTLREARIDADGLMPGRTHQRLEQVYKGVRVFGGDVVRQIGAGQVVSVFGALYDGIEMDVAPGLSQAEARDRLAALTASDPRAIDGPELTVLPLPAGGFALTYRALAWSAAGLKMYFLDAGTGAITWQYDDLQTQSAVRAGKGVLGDDKKVSMRQSNARYVADDLLRPAQIRTYDIQGNLTRTKQILAGLASLGDSDLAATQSDPWTDTAAVDAHVYEGWTYDFYFKRFGRRGLDDHNLPIVGIVHPADRANATTVSISDLGTFYVNAFWDSVGRRMVYGEGLPSNLTLGGQHWNYLSGSLDAVAHELSHGVTQFSSNLIYQNESGALNEAFSDIMGTSAEFYFQSVRGRASYIIGDDVVTPGGIRSMADPGAYGDPDHYSKRYTGTDQNFLVHTNSGIANQAFYLAIEGGTNRTSGLAVTGVGAANREQVERVFYRAFTSLLPASATFAMARQATIQASRDLYGSNSNAERAVTQAWTAVGVN